MDGGSGQMTARAKGGHVSFALALAGATLWGTVGAQAQEESTNRVAAKTDWSVFVEDNPRECWGVSAPKSWQAQRNGSDVTDDVLRGDILLFVTFRPGSGAAGEVSFTGGYPFAGGSTATVEIGGQEYQMFTDGEWAWPADADSDTAIVEAMKAGAEATVTAVSARGTTTIDTFSLMGFTAAMEDAESRCAE
jgi:hypothetical protein